MFTYTGHSTGLHLPVNLHYNFTRMWMYLLMVVNILLLAMLVRSAVLGAKQKNEDEYEHAVKRLFNKKTEIRDKFKSKF